MKTAPAIVLVIAGAALSGWLLECLTVTGQSPVLQPGELVIMLGQWLIRGLSVLADLVCGAATLR